MKKTTTKCESCLEGGTPGMERAYTTNDVAQSIQIYSTNEEWYFIFIL